MLRMIMDIKTNLFVCDDLSPGDSGAVFLSAVDGKLRSVNQVAARLLEEIEDVDRLLPEDHIGLIRACLNTRQSLDRHCEIDGFCILWSYQVSDKFNQVYISASDSRLSNMYSSAGEEKPGNSSLPLITLSQVGDLEFCNCAASKLMSDLDVECVEDMLPLSHLELLQACIKGKLALTEGRCINNKTYVWTYEACTEKNKVNIYARDLSINDEICAAADTLAWKKRELEFLANISGTTKFISFATYKLIDELGVSGVDDILSSSHQGLVKACLATSTSLTEECKLSNRSIVWTYHPHDDGESVQVYGYEAV